MMFHCPNGNMTENLGSFKHRGISKWKNHSGKGIAIIERDAGSRRESQVSFAVIPHLVYLDGKNDNLQPQKDNILSDVENFLHI